MPLKNEHSQSRPNNINLTTQETKPMIKGH